MATFTATGSKQSSYSYTLTLTQSYTAGSSSITYNYTLICTTSNNYYYQDTGTTRTCKIKYNNVEKTLFNNYAQISVNKNGTTTLDSGSITLDRFVDNEYRPQVYFTVYTTASSSYLPGTAEHAYSDGDIVPAKLTACYMNGFVSPAANTKVSRKYGFTLKWNAGTAGAGNSITGYKVECKIGDGAWKAVSTTGASTYTCDIIPNSYGSPTDNGTCQCRVKCIEKTAVTDNWATISFKINPIPANPTGVSAGGIIGSSAPAYTASASTTSGLTIYWYSGSTQIKKANSVSMNPDPGKSLTYTAYNYDGLDWSTGVNVTVTRVAKPSVTSVSITWSGNTVTAGSAVIATTASAHQWRFKTDTTYSTVFTTTASFSGQSYNIYNYISSTASGAISCSAEYRYQDSYGDWADWKGSTAKSIGSAVSGITLYNQFNNSNITDTDLGPTVVFYNKIRFKYTITDPSEFQVSKIEITKQTVTINNYSGYADLTLSAPNALTPNTSYTAKYTIVSKKGSWTKTGTFTFKTCPDAIDSVQLSTSGNTINPNTVSGTGTVRVGAPIGDLAATNSSSTNRLHIYSSAKSNASDSFHELLSNYSGSRSSSTYTLTNQVTLTDIYKVNNYNWYSNEDTANNTIYIVAKYTNALGKEFTVSQAFTIEFVTAPKLNTTTLAYTVGNLSGVKLQYNKTLSMNLSVTTYNYVSHRLDLYIIPSGGSAILLGRNTFTPTSTGAITATKTVSGTLPELTTNSYNFRVEFYKVGADDKIVQTWEGSDNAIKQYKGNVQYNGITDLTSGDNNVTFNVNYKCKDYGGTLGSNTTLQATFEAKITNESGTIDWSGYGASVSGTNFTNKESMSITANISFTQITGRIKIELTTTQTSGSTTLTSTLTYYSTEKVDQGNVATISYRKNAVVVNNLFGVPSNQIITINPVGARDRIVIYSVGTVSGKNGTIQCGTSSALPSLINFNIDCGSW